MDSLTQFVLGAAVGQLILGKKLGKKATLLGGVAGSLPDLDSILFINSDTITQLKYHRAFSHSIIGCTLSALLLSPLSQKLIKTKIKIKTWFLFWYLTFLTHALLDCFTSWGTQLFWPHPYRVALHAIFIIDPFYTIPLLIGVIITYQKKYLKPVIIGIIISSFYLILALGFKSIANYNFEKGLKYNNLIVRDYISKPTPFNILLWSITANEIDHYYYGYYSLLDKSYPTEFIKSQPKNHKILNTHKKNKDLQDLLNFTYQYYIVKDTNPITIFDTRYGLTGAWDSTFKGEYIFTFTYNPNTTVITQKRPKINNISKRLKNMIKRIFRDWNI